MSLQTNRATSRCRAGALAACGYAGPVAASGSPGAEGIVLVMLLLPVAIYFAAVAVLLLFRLYRRRGWMIANAIGSALATGLAGVALMSVRTPSGPGGTAFLLGTAAVLAFGIIAPWLQYRAARAQWRALSNLVLVLAALELSLPVVAWVAQLSQQAQFDQALENTERLGRAARSGDLAAAVRGRTGNELLTVESRVFLAALTYSPLLRDATALRDDDRAAAERLLADRATYSSALHAKLVWDEHAEQGVDALLADPDAPALRYWLLEMLERHAATRYCGDNDAIFALREGVQAWFAQETRASPTEGAARDARINALCTAVDAP